MDTAEDRWLTVSHMHQIAEARRSEHAAIVELHNQPAHPGLVHHHPIPQLMQRHGGRNDTKRA